MSEKNEREYIGIYDHKESNTFRPTIESRVHLNAQTSKTLTCREDSCCVIERERERESSLHIRKLTPKECFRLMGFSDESFQQLVNANFSNNTLYHLAGDSIVSTVISFIAAPLTLDEKQAEQRINEFIQMNILEYL